MATDIRLKSSSVSGKTPTLSDLSLRELAVNTVDGKLFLRKGTAIGTDTIVDLTNHSTLSNLANDDHTQYIHATTTRSGVSAEFNTTGKITTTNRIGIGTTNPTSSLHLAGIGTTSPTGDANRIRIGDFHWDNVYTSIHAKKARSEWWLEQNSDDVDGVDLIFYKSRGTPNLEVPVQVNDNVFRLTGRAFKPNAVGIGSTITTADWSGDTLAQIEFDVDEISGNNVWGRINFKTQSLSRMMIKSSGNVGIGTTTPAYKLDVLGDINFTGTFYQNGTQFVASRWAAGTGNNIYRLTGNVGLGTTNPTTTLHIHGGSDQGIRINATSGFPVFRLAENGVDKWSITSNFNSDSGFVIRETGIADRFNINIGGNIGIGTTNPRGKLDVTSPAAAYNSDSLVIGGGTLTYPTTQYSGWGGIVVKGTTSDARMFFQDGNGRINSYWNAYLDSGGYKYIVGGEPAVREQMHVAGTTGGIWSLYGAAAGTAGGALTWTQIAYAESGTSGVSGSVWFSPRGTSSDFYINSSGSIGIGTANPTEILDVVGNIKLTGELRGPASFVIDPAVVGDNTGTVVIKGNLQVDGTTTTLNSTTLTIDDKNIVIADGVTTLANLDTAGIDFGSTAVRIRYNHNSGTNSGLSIEGTNVGINVTNPITALDVGGILRLRRNDSLYEGGEIQFTRSIDNVNMFIMDVYGNTASARFRLFNGITGNEIYTVDADNNFIIGAASKTETASQPLQVTGGAYISGNVGIGTTNPSTNLHVQGSARITGSIISTNYFTTTSTGSVTGGAAIPISTISASSYRSVEYIIQAVSTINHQVTKLLLVHDGTNAYITEYGSMTTNAQVSSYVADISGGNIVVTATPISVNTTNYKVYATAIAV